MNKSRIKLRLTAIKMLFDWMVTGGVLTLNPSASVGGPKSVIKKGKTLVPKPEEARLLLDSIDVTALRPARSRAPGRDGST